MIARKSLTFPILVAAIIALVMVVGDSTVSAQEASSDIVDFTLHNLNITVGTTVT